MRAGGLVFGTEGALQPHASFARMQSVDHPRISTIRLYIKVTSLPDKLFVCVINQ